MKEALLETVVCIPQFTKVWLLFLFCNTFTLFVSIVIRENMYTEQLVKSIV